MKIFKTYKYRWQILSEAFSFLEELIFRSI